MQPVHTPPGVRPRLAQRVSDPFVRFADLEAAGAVVLLLMTAVALAWANSPWGHTYDEFWHAEAGVTFGPWFSLSLSLGHWVNEALMAIFFFVVGMEIKREMVLGELSTLRRALLPVMAALGGMIVPASIYASLHWGEPTLRGWAVPMATDIAFAIAALSLLGSRVPHGLRVFLLALAIADDLGAVSVIAIFYTEEIHLGSLGLAGLGLGLVWALNVAGVRSFIVFCALGAFVWYETHHSGVHATIAGVALGFLAPTTRDLEDRETLLDQGRQALDRLRGVLLGEGDDDDADHGGHTRHRALVTLQAVGRQALSPLDLLMNSLERWVAFFIMPVFALANAGVRIEASTLNNPVSQRVGLAVALGLLIGKPLGIAVFSWISVRSGLAILPRGVDWQAIFATGVLAGIGFTVALFVTALAFPDPAAIAGSKLGILVGSALATLIGVAILARALGPTQIDR
jgi:NhaA family Na+:H+ antiporter